MLELKVLESSDLTEVVVYGNYLYKLRTKWMLQSMAERHRLRQERGGRPITRWSGAGGWRGARADSFTPSPSAHLLTPPFPSSPPTTTHMQASPAGPSVSGLPLRLGRLVLGTLE